MHRALDWPRHFGNGTLALTGQMTVVKQRRSERTHRWPWATPAAQERFVITGRSLSE